MEETPECPPGEWVYCLIQADPLEAQTSSLTAVVILVPEVQAVPIRTRRPILAAEAAGTSASAWTVIC